MLAKYWKKIGIFILIIACIFNMMMKLVKKVSINTEIDESVKYMQEQQKEEKQKEK